MASYVSAVAWPMAIVRQERPPGSVLTVRLLLSAMLQSYCTMLRVGLWCMFQPRPNHGSCQGAGFDTKMDTIVWWNSVRYWRSTRGSRTDRG